MQNALIKTIVISTVNREIFIRDNLKINSMCYIFVDSLSHGNSLLVNFSVQQIILLVCQE